MSETRRRQRRTPAWRRFLRAWRWWVPPIVIVLLAGGGGAYVSQDIVTHTPPRLAGTPLVTARNETMLVVFLTSHQEVRTTRLNTLLRRPPEPPVLHWDLWAFDGRDLKQRWVTRLASVRRGQHDPERGVVGTEAGVIWVLANRLVAVNLSGGRIIGDSSMIEARNIQLRGRFPNTSAAFRFNRGLIVTAANGTELRVDPVGMSARPLATSGAATDAVQPLAMVAADQALKRRAIIDARLWLGVMTGEERARPNWPELPAEPNFALGHAYRLVRAEIQEQRAPTGELRRGLRNVTPLDGVGEFRDGGLLALDTQRGSVAPVSILNPPRHFLLHRAGTGPEEALTSIDRAGGPQWQSNLGMVAITGGVLANEGLPSTWAILLMGRAGGASNDPVDKVVRVNAQNGTVHQVSIPALPLAQLQYAGSR